MAAALVGRFLEFLSFVRKPSVAIRLVLTVACTDQRESTAKEVKRGQRGKRVTKKEKENRYY